MIILKNINKIKKILKKKCLIIFSATWCAPCHLFKTKISFIEKKINLLILNIDVEQNNIFSLKFGIKSIPYVILCINDSIIKIKNLNIKKLISIIFEKV